MPIYKVDPNPNRIAYGTTIGILQSCDRIPMVPGDVGNASTYKFPVAYKVVEGLNMERLIVKADPTLVEPIIHAAHDLEMAGVAAITSDCGYMISFQKDVAAAVNVPVFLSSWLQLSFIRQILPINKRIGVIVGNGQHLSDQVFMRAGVDNTYLLAVTGMEKQPAFRSAILEGKDEIDTDKVEQEAVIVASDLKKAHPDLGAILLECSDLPPYAAAIQQAVHLPVFDYTTMINFIYSSLVRSRFHGSYY